MIGGSGNAEASNLVQYDFDGSLEDDPSVHIEGFIKYDSDTPLFASDTSSGTVGYANYDSTAQFPMEYSVTVSHDGSSNTITDTSTTGGSIQLSYSIPSPGSEGSAFEFTLGGFDFTAETRATGQLAGPALPTGISTAPNPSILDFSNPVGLDDPDYHGYVDLTTGTNETQSFILNDVNPVPEPSTIIPAATATALLIGLGYARRHTVARALCAIN